MNPHSSLRGDYAHLIRDVERAIRPLVDAIDVEDLSRHNAGYRKCREHKFRELVGFEKNRWLRALSWIDQTMERGGSICDLGCFIPYLPVALAMVGYQVTILEKYSLYGQRLKDSVYQLAAAHGIQVCDRDIVNDDLSSLGRFDAVLLMAVVEHLNGSPRKLLESLHALLAGNGFLLFEVPNIAEFCKRLKFLLGYSPLAEYADYLDSAYPFLGHNREMTVSEVRYLLAQTGFEIERLECRDYCCWRAARWRGRVLQLLKKLVPMRNKHQSIMVMSRPRRADRPRTDLHPCFRRGPAMTPSDL